MIRHLARLVWNRKWQNLLLAFEIFLSFLVLLAVTFFAVLNIANWRYPLGFTIDRLWAIELQYPQAGLPGTGSTAESATARAEAAQTMQRVLAAVRALPRVERVAASFLAPYDSSSWVAALGEPARAESFLNVADDQFAGLVGIDVIAGRWFSRDDGGTANAAVINRRLARELFGDGPVLNRPLPSLSRNRFPSTRIVGVIEDFRQGGEFTRPGNYTFFRLPDGDRAVEVLPTVLTVRVAPGTTAEFEQTLVDTLQGIARDWRFNVQSMDARRNRSVRESLLPLAAMGIVAAFLLLMVALGLTGVVWQSVTRRFNEFGLRRANGATVHDVRRQVLTELAILTTLALIVGAAVVAQLPVLALVDPDLSPPTGVFIASIAISMAVIYLLTLLCGWYPSRLATQIQPAEALRYE